MPKKLLIVDDDSSIISILTYAFNDKGYEVVSASSGAQAQTLAYEERPDIIVLDVLMPGVDGFALLKEFRASKELAKTPIVMISGVYKTYSVIQDALKDGANDFFKKPFDLERLVSRVQSLCPMDIEEMEEIAQQGSKAISKYLFIDEIPFSGEFGVIPVCKVFSTLFMQKLNGILTLNDKSIAKKIMIRDGVPIEVSSNIAGEWLGRLLVREGAITAEQYKETLELMGQLKKRHGEILIEKKLLTPGDLFKYLKMQLVEKIINTFNWTDGVYNFEPDIELDRASPKQINVYKLVYDGIKSKVGIDYIKNELMEINSNSVFALRNAASLTENFGFSGAEQRLLNYFNGSKKLSSVQNNALESIEDFYCILYTLLLFGSLRLVGEVSGRYESLDKASKYAARSTEPLTEDEKKAAASIGALFKGLKNMNYYDFFGIDQDADTSTIKKAYFKLAKDIHPDKFAAQKFDNIRGRASKVFSEMANAYQTLVDAELRKKYDKELKGDDSDSEELKKAHEILTAEMQFQKGIAYLNSKDFKNAMDSFNWAVKLNPNEAEYHLYKAIAIFKAPDSNAGESRHEAKGIIQDVISMNPNLPEAHYYLGMIYKLENDLKSATESFYKTIKLDRNHAEANRELRLMKMREEKGKSKGFLKGLFK